MHHKPDGRFRRARRATGRLDIAKAPLAAVLVASLYVVYVAHYAVNVPYADDWNTVPLIINALHGHLAMHDLWAQYGDTRLLIADPWFILIGRADRYNLATVLVSGALFFVAAFMLLLVALRSYVGKRLHWLTVIVVGLAWFSLADVQNALWAFQLAWYVATFFFVVTVVCLLAERHRPVMLGLAAIAALAGSYTIVQGFVCWPVGLICLLRIQPWTRRTAVEVSAWVGTATIAAAIYLHGYQPSASTGRAFTHPNLVGRYVLLLLGNVIPTSLYRAHPNLAVHELLGVIVVSAAGYVAVRTYRERDRPPLPLLLIAYGVCFDVMIAVGRFNGGPAGALNNNRYTMPNLVLITGIVIYVCSHTPELAPKRPWQSVGVSMLVAVFAIDCGATTIFGVTNARRTRSVHVTDARIVVNFDLIPTVAAQGCAAAYAVYPPHSPAQGRNIVASVGRDLMAYDRLSVFEPHDYAHYRAQGLPSDAAVMQAANFAGVTNAWATQCPG